MPKPPSTPKREVAGIAWFVGLALGFGLGGAFKATPLMLEALLEVLLKVLLLLLAVEAEVTEAEAEADGAPVVTE